MNKNGFFKCDNCGHYQHTTEFGQCEECDYEELIEITEEEYDNEQKEFNKMNKCTFCGRKSTHRTKSVGGYEILECCTDCEDEILKV